MIHNVSTITPDPLIIFPLIIFKLLFLYTSTILMPMKRSVSLLCYLGGLTHHITVSAIYTSTRIQDLPSISPSKMFIHHK